MKQQKVKPLITLLLRALSNEGFESKPATPPIKKGAVWWSSESWLPADGQGLILLRLTPSVRLRCAAASCGASRLVERRVRIKPCHTTN
jgi:hypothetical protein